MLGTLTGQLHLFSIVGSATQTLEGFSSLALATAISSDGRLAAAGGGATAPDEGVIRVWDLETGEVRVLDPPKREFIASVDFTPEGDLVVASASGVWLWNLDDGTNRRLREWKTVSYGIAALSGDGKKLVSFGVDLSTNSSTPAVLLDLETGEERELDAFGTKLSHAALDENGENVVTGGQFGEVQFGPTKGDQPPHLLLGHEGLVFEVAFAFDDQQILSAGVDGTIRVWPVPEGRPFDTLSYEELLDRLRSVTNYRVVEDASTSTGYRLEAEPFKGWAEVPEW